jgi:tetratricopeptide (TPR) repeat protein
MVLIVLTALSLFPGCSSGSPAVSRGDGTVEPVIPPEEFYNQSKIHGISTDPAVYPHVNPDGTLSLFRIGNFEFKIPIMTFSSRKGARGNTGAGELDWIITECTRMINSDSQNTEAYIRRAGAYYERDNPGDTDLALQDCNKALSLNPNEKVTYYVRGLIYARKGMYDQAIADIKTVLSINQYHEIGIYYVLGQIYNEKGDLDWAIDAFEQVYRINPDFADTASVLDTLRSRKK